MMGIVMEDETTVVDTETHAPRVPFLLYCDMGTQSKRQLHDDTAKSKTGYGHPRRDRRSIILSLLCVVPSTRTSLFTVPLVQLQRTAYLQA